MTPSENIAIKNVSRRFKGLSGSALAWAVGRHSSQSLQTVVVCKDRKNAEVVDEDLALFCGQDSVVGVPALDSLPFEMVSPAPDASGARLFALWQFLNRKKRVLVITPEVLLQKVVAPKTLRLWTRELQVGAEISRSELISYLDAVGYTRVALVEDVGEIAVRGGVIDLFLPERNIPVRLEISEGRIAGIREFDADSQRSIREVSSVLVTPVTEYLFDSLDGAVKRAALASAIRARGVELEVPPSERDSIIEGVRAGVRLPGVENYLSLAQPLASVSEYLSSKIEVFLESDHGVQDSLERWFEIVQDRHSRQVGEHKLTPILGAVYNSPREVCDWLSSCKPQVLGGVALATDDQEEEIKYEVNSLAALTEVVKAKSGSGKAFRPLREKVESWRALGFRVGFVVGANNRVERLQAILEEYGVGDIGLEPSAVGWLYGVAGSPVGIIRGQLGGGFELPAEKLALVSELDLFSERSFRKSKRRTQSLKRLMNAVANLKEGDYVVHVDYGIGIYRGLKHVTVDGVFGDFLLLDYAGNSKLYLPVHSIGKIQKYAAIEGQVPQLDRLGTPQWSAKKQKVRDHVALLAADLMKLYAERAVVKGWRFESYGAADEEFAESFPYNETPDQQKAIEDTINDMAADKPMDRLVCGDAGFGKTEVAIRAAFKCISHARQVAVLAPTTILVEQHKETFMRRFRDVPVKIGAVSRFYTAEQNKATLEAVAAGEIDIVVGTHRLLQHDVQFKDIGLLIIDEEHRFGVQQKERLKQIKKNVDVLTLTATPIPRTLHMALIGIRDISVIATPPTDRKVIKTFIAEFEPSTVKDAIQRELQRGGQVFFLHNRIETLPTVALMLKELVPEAVVEYAHGQMDEKVLEGIMKRFLNKEIQVLLSTTIIESGIDIPNANTIIIDRADALGIAQLYQLRGRVGRSDKEAFAYLLIPKVAAIGPEAEERLKALQSLDDLGMGFNLAVRDMEIRGAGALLGKEQSGSVFEVGFDLYSQILREAIGNLKDESPILGERPSADVRLGVVAFIPDSYIPDISERLLFYQRISGASSEAELISLQDEGKDRFGDPPREVINFFELMYVRLLLNNLGVAAAEFTGGKLRLTFGPNPPIDPARVAALVRAQPKRYSLSKSQVFAVVHEKEAVVSPVELVPLVRDISRKLSATALSQAVAAQG